jgi:peptide/nickel transport system substrate-binding protein
MGSGKRSLSKVWLATPLLSLLLVVACGTAAPPEPVAEPEAPAVVEATPIPTAAPEALAAPAEVEVHPGKLTIMVAEWGNERFDNAFAVGRTRNYAAMVHAHIISGNEKKEMVPGIASNWSFSTDGLTLTLTIREGVKFHDGSDLTVQDVLWSLQHYFDPQALEYARQKTIPRAMDKIELSGPNEVALTTKFPVAELAINVSQAGNAWYPAMPERTKLHDPEAEAAYDRNPIGAGPMRLAKHVQAAVMSFERFDDFYYQPENGFPEDKRVNFQLLDLFLVPEEATRVAALRAGEADMAVITEESRPQVEAGGGRLVFSPEGQALYATLPGCWLPQYPCHDRRVRQALNYALDKELFRDRLLGGPEAFEVKGDHFITPHSIGFTPALVPYPYDPDKARQLLADAGYPGGQGFGKLIMNTPTSAGIPHMVESAELAAGLWRRELGLDVEVNPLDPVAISRLIRTDEIYGRVYWRDAAPRVDVTSALIRRFGDPEEVTRLHEDPDLQRLVQEAVRIIDTDKRREPMERLAVILREESYKISIGYANVAWGVGPRVLAWQPNPLSYWPSALHTITLE